MCAYLFSYEFLKNTFFAEHLNTTVAGDLYTWKTNCLSYLVYTVNNVNEFKK